MITKMRDLDLDTWLLVMVGLLVAVLLVLAGLGVKVAIEADKKWRAWCAEQGGIVLEDTRVKNTVSYDAKGNPVMGLTSTTVQLCVVDGAVINVRTT